MKVFEFLSISLAGSGLVGAVAVPGNTNRATDATGGQLHVAAVTNGSTISRSGWTVSADSYQPGNEVANAIDGNRNTFWHTEWNPVNVALPHNYTIDMKTLQNVNGFSYLPRQDGNSNGNIGQHAIYVSKDGVNYGSPVAFGTFLDDSEQKNVTFETVQARYIRINAITEAGNRGPWTSAAEFNAYQAPGYSPQAASGGRWGQTINFPIVPVEVALEPITGRVLAWSSYSAIQFTGSNNGQTVTSTWDPSSNIVTNRLVTNTQHDMFCPGISLDFNGRPVVTGGNSADRTSIYNSADDSWFMAAGMKIPRGYQASATTSDGRIFTIGGSWSGGYGGKNGEIYDTNANTWSLLSGCPVAPMLTNDAQGIFRQDSHAWLFGWKSGSVFQAGPSKAMNWYGTNSSTGSQKPAGNRATDGDSMCGNAVMYDAVQGKILTLGGSPNYQGSASTTAAHVITIGSPNSTPSVATLGSMKYQRIFANAIALPDGTVFVTGGQVVGNPFHDTTSQFTPELWNPSTGKFTSMTSNSIPRNYHSVALLLLDGTVLSAGGGLCGTCTTNHFDGQIYTPPYLLNPDGSARARPAITSVSASTVQVGKSLTFKTNKAIKTASLIRYGSATHTVDTDQRRIPLTLRSAGGGNAYSFSLPSDPGVALPGYWMLFAMDSAGTPSVAQTVKITP